MGRSPYQRKPAEGPPLRKPDYPDTPDRGGLAPLMFVCWKREGGSHQMSDERGVWPVRIVRSEEGIGDRGGGAVLSGPCPTYVRAGL